MDELEQRCYDLDAKVRRVEDERDVLVSENDELQDQINQLKSHVEKTMFSSPSGEDSTREEISRLGEEVLRLDTVFNDIKESVVTVNEKMKEVNLMKDTIKSLMEETSCVKEDFLNLKNHLNIAAKIELQTNEKMYENRLHHLEKMLEEMRHREETFLHIAEETNILKDQVDSLRELSLTSLKCDRPQAAILTLPLDEELKYNGHPESISYESPVNEQLPSIAYEEAKMQQSGEQRSSRGSSPEKQSYFSTAPLKITGQLKLSSTPSTSSPSGLTLVSSPTPRSLNTSATQTSIIEGLDKMTKTDTRIVLSKDDKVYTSNCMQDLFAKLWVYCFD